MNLGSSRPHVDSKAVDLAAGKLPQLALSSMPIRLHLDDLAACLCMCFDEQLKRLDIFKTAWKGAIA
jgi:hypothetical protein